MGTYSGDFSNSQNLQVPALYNGTAEGVGTCTYLLTLAGTATVTVASGISLVIFDFPGTETWKLTGDSGEPDGSGGIGHYCTATGFYPLYGADTFLLSVDSAGKFSGSDAANEWSYAGVLQGHTISGTLTVKQTISPYESTTTRTVTFQGPLNLVLK